MRPCQHFHADQAAELIPNEEQPQQTTAFRCHDGRPDGSSYRKRDEAYLERKVQSEQPEDEQSFCNDNRLSCSPRQRRQTLLGDASAACTSEAKSFRTTLVAMNLISHIRGTATASLAWLLQARLLASLFSRGAKDLL